MARPYFLRPFLNMYSCIDSNMEKNDYFLRFPTFQRDPTTFANVEFSRLARQMNWNKRSKKYKLEQRRFLVSEFNIHYGTEATKLKNWQALCIELEICQSIESISKCRKVRVSV